MLNYIKKDLCVDIDISDFTLENGNILKSVAVYDNAKTVDITLPDFGLTGYDVGLSTSLTDGLELDGDNTLELKLISHNDENGVNHTNDYQVYLVTGNTFGNYIYLNGGYFHGYFKLEGYDYELLPSRYPNGISIETLIDITDYSKGIFLYLGTRSEDKYSPYFTGETNIVSVDTVNYGGNQSEDNYVVEGYKTSEGNYLTTTSLKYVNSSSVANVEDIRIYLNNIAKNSNVKNIANNVISFEITEAKKIGVKYIGEKGNVISKYSDNSITTLGWTLIDIVFSPDSELLSECDSLRQGNLTIYLNGAKFWEIENFKEFYFHGLENHKEKQIGVPYNIVWGGGSYGLKHSYHFTDNGIVQDPAKSNLTIEKYFNSSYIGGIQKLRIYNSALTQNQVKFNLKYEQSINPTIFKYVGGRIIKNPFGEPVCTSVPHPTGTYEYSGSDIRKSIKYRNSDDTYRNLVNMIDIKVVVKSRNNPDIELIKFKKIADTDWLSLIYIDDYTYDFIVPDEITSAHPYEILFAEIKFEWSEPFDTDNVFEKIYSVNLTTPLKDNTIKYL